MSRTTFHYRDPLAPRATSQTLGVTALIERDGRLLLERRSDTGQWGLVGGPSVRTRRSGRRARPGRPG